MRRWWPATPASGAVFWRRSISGITARRTGRSPWCCRCYSPAGFLGCAVCRLRSGHCLFPTTWALTLTGFPSTSSVMAILPELLIKLHCQLKILCGRTMFSHCGEFLWGGSPYRLWLSRPWTGTWHCGFRPGVPVILQAQHQPPHAQLPLNQVPWFGHFNRDEAAQRLGLRTFPSKLWHQGQPVLFL